MTGTVLPALPTAPSAGRRTPCAPCPCTGRVHVWCLSGVARAASGVAWHAVQGCQEGASSTGVPRRCKQFMPYRGAKKVQAVFFNTLAVTATVDQSLLLLLCAADTSCTPKLARKESRRL